MSPAERERLGAFAKLSIRDVRARADEFQAAQDEYAAWLRTRRAQRDHPPDGRELVGYAPEVQYGNLASDWRALERELRERKLWLVGELSAADQVSWARRVNALSTEFARPVRRSVGPATPLPRVAERRDLP